jgi:hypothetical protein
MIEAKRCVVNAAVGPARFKRGQDRLVNLLFGVGCREPIMLVDDANQPEGMPSHQEVPYGFKVWSMEAAQKAGYNVLLWLDTSIMPVHNLDVLWTSLEDTGYLYETNDQVVGNWATDAFLRKHSLTRDAAMYIPDGAACMLGLDLRWTRSVTFLWMWKRLAMDGVSFLGPRSRPATDTSDPRYLGHRWDQTAASYLMYTLGLPVQPRRFHAYDEPWGTTHTPGPDCCLRVRHSL